MIQNKTFNRLIDERTDEKRETAEEIDYDKLTYYFKGPHMASRNFFKHKPVFHIFQEIEDGDKALQAIVEDQKKKKNHF